MKPTLILRLLAPLCFAAPALADFRAGAAQVIINPPVGVNMAGYYNFRACEGVLDDIRASALVLDDGTTRAALITLDLIGTPRELVEAVRAAVEKSGTLPGAHVMISATHAHTGPVPGRFVRTPDGPEGGGPEPGSVHAKYMGSLPGLIASSVIAAATKLTPVNLTGVTGE